MYTATFQTYGSSTSPYKSNEYWYILVRISINGILTTGSEIPSPHNKLKIKRTKYFQFDTFQIRDTFWATIVYQKFGNLSGLRY
eukprot:COSAG02_NODE_7312_length_3069_cov_4.205724_1_plen_84_part_00